MKKLVLAVAILSLGAAAIIATAIAQNGSGGNSRSFSAKLTGFQEIITAGGAVSTTGRGRFSARVSSDEISYRLSYQNLEGGNVLFAHIHFGQLHTTGGVSAFLCGDAAIPDPAPPNNIPNACPASGEVTGTITPADVVGPAGQGIDPGEFSELVRAMRHGVTYANVHTVTYPMGEIRGQIRHGRHHGHGNRGKGKGN